METALTISLYVTTFVLVYRGWWFHILKNKVASVGKRGTFWTFLRTDFGNINHLFIWYIGIPLEADKKLVSLIKLVNLLTTVFLLSSVISLGLFFLQIFTQ